MPGRPSDSMGRALLAAMLAVTVILVAGVAAAGFLSVTAKSVILIAWMAVMMAVLRRTQG